MGVKKSDDRETEEREMTKQKIKQKIGRYKYKTGNRTNQYIQGKLDKYRKQTRRPGS